MQGRLDVLAPLALTENLGKFDVRATVKGGGTTGQAQVGSCYNISGTHCILYACLLLCLT